MEIGSTHTCVLAEPSDQAIWIAFQDGDKDALASLYARHFKSLIAYGRKISVDKDLVKDCIHDLFVEIWNNRRNLSLPRSVKAYLLICVQRKLVRQKKRRRIGQVEVTALPDTQLVESAEDQIISDQNTADRQHALKAAMTMLTNRQRQVIHLKFYANLSYEEIVEVMNISADAVYNLVSKAIDALQSGVPHMNK